MTAEHDIYFALKRAEQLFDDGYREDAAVWRQIVNATVELQRPRQDDEALN